MTGIIIVANALAPNRHQGIYSNNLLSLLFFGIIEINLLNTGGFQLATSALIKASIL